MAKDDVEAEQLMDFSINYEHPLAIRYPRGNTLINKNKEAKTIKLGEWKKENDVNSDKVIISYGPVINELKERFNDVQIVNALFQKPIDVDLLKSLLNKEIIIYDLYGSKEGFASIVIDALNELGYQKQVKTLCVPNDFISHGSIKEQRNRLNLDLDSLEKLIKE